MKIPPEHHHFWYWLFDFCSYDTGNFGRANDNRKYGISGADFVAQYPDEALEDARNYFEKFCSTEEEKRVMLRCYCEDREREMEKILIDIQIVEEIL